MKQLPSAFLRRLRDTIDILGSQARWTPQFPINSSSSLPSRRPLSRLPPCCPALCMMSMVIGSFVDCDFLLLCHFYCFQDSVPGPLLTISFSTDIVTVRALCGVLSQPITDDTQAYLHCRASKVLTAAVTTQSAQYGGA